MKDNYTHIVFILDRSGSMQNHYWDTLNGFNKFLREQQALDGEATFSLILFDDKYEVVHNFTDLKDVPKLTAETFVPRGWTALLDAVGRTINETGERLAALPESLRPGKVIIAVLTDGQENRSRLFSAAKIREMIEHQQTKYSWQVTFLSSDIRAYEQALTLGFSADNARPAKSIAAAMINYSAGVERTRGLSGEAYSASIGSFWVDPDGNDITKISNSSDPQVAANP